MFFQTEELNRGNEENVNPELSGTFRSVNLSDYNGHEGFYNLMYPSCYANDVDVYQGNIFSFLYCLLN